MTPDVRRRNARMMAGLFVLVFAMVGLAFASAPLYSLFCRVTGFGGTTQRADAAPGPAHDGAAAGRVVTIRFNADVNGPLPWRFRPNQHDVKLALGEQGFASYSAQNRGSTPVTGTAVFNVTPDKAGLYFNKIQCFCFTEQTLAPGQTVDMPVMFFVDPAMANDPDLADVSTITLSYTFFRATRQSQQTAERPAP